MKNTTIENGTTAEFKGQTVKVISYEKGWYAVKLTDGTVAKARGKQLTVNENQEKDATTKRNVVNADIEHYARGLGQTAGGNDTLDINDRTAETLRGLDLDGLYAIASGDIWVMGPECLSKSMQKLLKGTNWDAESIADFLKSRYEERNEGMQRMNVGNILRSAVNRHMTTEKD